MFPYPEETLAAALDPQDTAVAVLAALHLAAVPQLRNGMSFVRDNAAL